MDDFEKEYRRLVRKAAKEVSLTGKPVPVIMDGELMILIMQTKQGLLIKT